GGLSDQPAAVGQDQKRIKRRPCTVGGFEDYRRQRGRDQCLYSGGILDAGGGFLRGRKQKAAESEVLRKRKGEDGYPLWRRAGTDQKRAGKRAVPCGGYQEGRTGEKIPAALYHQYAAAGGGKDAEFFHSENHAFGSAVV